MEVIVALPFFTPAKVSSGQTAPLSTGKAGQPVTEATTATSGPALIAGPTPVSQAVPLPSSATSIVGDSVDELTTDAVSVVDPVERLTDSAETEAHLTVEIVKLWRDHKSGKDTVRRTRSELKTLRVALGEKLHTMKAILVGTGRGGGWASFLRSQKLPLTTADRYVAEHETSLTSSAEKVTTGDIKEPTVDEVHQLVKKLLPRLSRMLTSQDLVFEFVHGLLWSIDVAEVTDTEEGMVIPRSSQEDSTVVEFQGAELETTAPVLR